MPGTQVDPLIDAGPLVAVLNRADAHHAACVAIIRALDSPFYTTLPVITEAMYLVGARMGWAAQEALWRLLLRGDLLLQHPSREELNRMAELMGKFSDRPMDFADASLVALAGAPRALACIHGGPRGLLHLPPPRPRAFHHPRTVAAGSSSRRGRRTWRRT